MNPHGLPAWLDRFPNLQAMQGRTWERLLQASQELSLPAGATVFRPGDPCRSFLLVLAGSIRVQKISETGREIVLYRLEPGESCVLTTTCLLAGDTYPAEAVAETAVRAVAFPGGLFQEALGASPAFRGFVFSSYAKRVTDLILLVEEITFRRMDTRLARRLLEIRPPGGPLNVTHQELAAQLGTAREVVSRLLKEFERRGWVRLHRGRIEIRDRAALAGLPDQSPG